MDIKAQIDEMILKARQAQSLFESYNQEQVDALVKAIAKVVYDNANHSRKWQLKRQEWVFMKTR